MRARVSRKWYLVVIVLLYIGLLASFSLNVTLLMRKPVLNQVTFPETDGELSFDKLYSKLDKLKLIIFSIYINVGYFLFPGYPPATTPTSDIRRTEKNTQLGFAYTTPCLVTGDITCSSLVCSQSALSQFPASQASCMTVTAESVSNVLMAATSLSGVTLTTFREKI